MPQANRCIRTQREGRDAAVPSDAQPHCQGLGNRSCTHVETERGAAASCFERMRWRERKRRNSSSSSLLRRVWRARAVPGLKPGCDIGGFVVQEPSSGAAFPYRRITCLPGTASHSPHSSSTRLWDTCPMMVCDFRGHIFLRDSRRGKRAAEEVKEQQNMSQGSLVAFRVFHQYSPWCFIPSRFKSSAHALELFFTSH